MALATARAPQPGKQKGRPWQDGPSNFYINNGIDSITATALQAQYLKAIFGLTPARAAVVAPLAFGGAHD